MKFATKLTFIVLGILVFFAAVISYVVYRANIKTLEDQITGRQLDTASHIMDKIDRMLFERFADIKAIASDPIVSSRDSTPGQIRKRLSEFRNYFKTYISISLFDLNRVRIADTSGLAIGEQHPLEGYWEDVLDGKDSVMYVSKSVSLRRTVIHFAFPVKDKSGETFGIVVTRMPTSKLFYIIREVGNIQEEDLQIDLIDKDGLLLYSTYNRKGVLKDNLADWKIVKDSLAIQEISTGRFLHEGIEDIYALVYEQGYLDFKGNDWRLMFHVPTKVAFSPAVKLRNTMMYILAVVLTLSVIIVFFLSRSITRPIASLAKGTEIIGKGILDHKVEVKTRDEIGQLAVSFNKMVEDLKKSNMSLLESEERFRAIFEQAAVGVAQIVTKTGQFVRINQRYCDIVGCTQDEMTKTTFMKITHPDDLQVDLDNMQKLIKGEIREFSMEKRYYHKDGSIVWVNLAVSPMWNVGEEPDYHIAVVEDMTERKRAEEALRSSEARARRLIESNIIGVILADFKGQILEANDAFLRMAGYTREDISNGLVRWLEMTPHEYKRLDEQAIEQLRATGRYTPFEKEYIRKDGERVPVVVGGTLLEGKEDLSVAFVLDITERKNAEKQISKLSQAIEQSPASIVITDNKGDIEYVNPQFTKITGYSKDEVMGKNPRILKSGVQPPDFYTKLWSIITSGNEWKGRFCNKKKNGELYWEFQSISPIKDEKGNMINFVAVKIDDTERVRAEEDARRSDHRFARMLEVSEDAIVSINENQRIIIFNKGAESIFDYKQSEIIGKQIEILFSKKHKDAVKKYLNNRESIVRHEEIFGLRKDGEEFPAEISISGFKEDGKMVTTVVLHDITERKEMEKEILKAQKLESVGVLAGGIAHDFNNILTAVLGNIQLTMMQSKKEDKIYENLQNVERASLQARDLTKQLLTFSKGGAPVIKTSNIAGLLKDSVRFALRGSKVRGELSIPEDLWAVDVDEGQINQVIHNMVINGQQAMPAGGVLKVKAENIGSDNSKDIVSLKQGRYVKISIEDRGTGIPEDLIERIFDPYFTTKQMGSGLGLASSYSIIKNHGGLITVDSKVEVGTTFSVYIPASSKEIADEKKIEDKSIVGSGKILIMDDDEAIRDMGKQHLGFIGYEVECAEDGAVAIEMYKKAKEAVKPYDVVVMDLTIPGGMGGKEAIKKLHKIYPEAKAIVSSGYLDNPVMAEFEKYGFKGAVSKPFEIKEMNEVLQRVIKG